MRQTNPTELILLGLVVLLGTALFGLIAVSYPSLIPALGVALAAMVAFIAFVTLMRS
ncbi:hypothetical protein [Streptomyces atroolivaceus]|uniref:hypothetical protein n=1 Tax=Streptomyces atroolivaceus TaxID=66869 RepID=UPI0036A2BF83